MHPLFPRPLILSGMKRVAASLFDRQERAARAALKQSLLTVFHQQIDSAVKGLRRLASDRPGMFLGDKDKAAHDVTRAVFKPDEWSGELRRAAAGPLMRAITTGYLTAKGLLEMKRSSKAFYRWIAKGGEGSGYDKATGQIESLEDFLTQHGMVKDYAAEVFDAYYRDESGSCLFASEDSRWDEDYSDAVVELVEQWEAQVRSRIKDGPAYPAKARPRDSHRDPELDELPPEIQEEMDWLLNFELPLAVETRILESLKYSLAQDWWDDMNRVTMERIENAVKDNLERSLKEMTAEVEDALGEISEHRAENIARTEATACLAQGHIIQGKEVEDAGFRVLKYWLNMDDPLVRPSHVKAAESPTSPVEGAETPFKIETDEGIVEAMAPGDPALPPAERCNCRCTPLIDVAGDLEADESLTQEVAAEVAAAMAMERKGGPGSGNFGHAGRPGQVGGSAEGEGTESEAAVFHGTSQRIGNLIAKQGLILSEAKVEPGIFASDDLETALAYGAGKVRMEGGSESAMMRKSVALVELDPKWFQKRPVESESIGAYNTEWESQQDVPVEAIKRISLYKYKDIWKGGQIQKDAKPFDVLLPASGFAPSKKTWRQEGVQLGGDVVLVLTQDEIEGTIRTRDKGGPGSGNFGHAGRPGMVGGSSGEGSGEPGEANPKVLTWAQKRFGDEKKAQAFAKWFGQSKVVDDNGEPLVVYHGTRTEFSEFDIGKFGQFDEGWLGEGFYFADTERAASSYANPFDPETGKRRAGGVIKPVYLSLQNPVIVDFKAKDNSAREFNELRGSMSARDFTTHLTSKGHDGVIFLGPDLPSGGRDIQYLAFHSTQIKSANNRGTFDPNDPNINN